MNKIINELDYVASFFKGLVGTVFAGISSYLFPVNNFLIVIAILFSFNFLFGWLTAIKTDERFSTRKSFRALSDLLIYFGLIVTTFVIGRYMKIIDTQIIEFISWLTWLVIYFYVVNITKNLKSLAPENRVIDMLHWFINIEFVKKIKFLKDYLNTKQHETNQ